tara:strand:+ start:2407 stop:2589 length:183 start_codon:yes stop_codon:yes gene_type:complete
MALFVFGALQQTSFDRFSIGILGLCASLLVSLGALLAIAFDEFSASKRTDERATRVITTQ